MATFGRLFSTPEVRHAFEQASAARARKRVSRYISKGGVRK